MRLSPVKKKRRKGGGANETLACTKKRRKGGGANETKKKTLACAIALVTCATLPVSCIIRNLLR